MYAFLIAAALDRQGLYVSPRVPTRPNGSPRIPAPCCRSLLVPAIVATKTGITTALWVGFLKACFFFPYLKAENVIDSPANLPKQKYFRADETVSECNSTSLNTKSDQMPVPIVLGHSEAQISRAIGFCGSCLALSPLLLVSRSGVCQGVEFYARPLPCLTLPAN